jgi:HK97 family phage portal protein
LKIFGLTLFEQKAVRANGTLLPVNSRAGWFGSVLESFTGAWQRNVEVKLDTVLTYSTVFRCISLISSDVSKMRMKLVELTDGIWNETSSPSFTPVLTKPNRYQNRIQFFASWIISKLVWGNAYILLERDARKVVVRMYVLDPTMVTPLVAPDGAVYYQLKRDDLAGIPADAVAVPASEIIHDRWNTLFHPLVGLSPIYACGISAIQGLKIKNNSAVFFGNGSQPGGVLTAPGAIGGRQTIPAPTWERLRFSAMASSLRRWR